MKKTAFWILTVLLGLSLLLAACDSNKDPQTPVESAEQTTASSGDGATTLETEGETEPETEPHVHAFGDWTTVKDATCTEAGEQKRTCECGETETQSIDAAHKWSELYECDDQNHWRICSVCSEADTKAAHDAAANGFCSVCNIPVSASDGVKYAISADGTYAEVIGYEGTFTQVNIAAQYEGLPVKAIATSAFEGKNITTSSVGDMVIA